MMYYKVPYISVNGVMQLDLNYHDLIAAIHIPSANEAIVQLVDTATLRSSWISATQTDWDNATAPSLEQVKQDKITQLQQSYVNSFTTFQSSTLGTVKTYPIDSEAQKNLDDLQNRLIADPNKTTFYFKTNEDGTVVAHTRSQFLQLMADAETFKVGKVQHYDSLFNQVNSATTIDAVNAVTW